ncbi:nucleotidyltransferase domain-containing protein [Selenomonadales bacterium OttesenSCG-928-I06]|nr:nucleotidyltransferase domain-containing protein [Selenomonadales bacterium OttesenSCG-928-I06]
MININEWLGILSEKLSEKFKERLLFVGLHGSYSRREATESSDIDTIVILDYVDINDLRAYRSIIATMPEKEKACGFISGKDVINNWPKYEIFQLTQETKTFYGSLKGLLPEVTREDIIDNAKNNVANLYHLTCHQYTYGNINCRELELKNAYKTIFFILQVVYYLRSGTYIYTKKELLPLLKDEEKQLLTISMNWQMFAGEREDDPEKFYNFIIKWGSNILKEF